jgi:hypothetical protein
VKAWTRGHNHKTIPLNCRAFVIGFSSFGQKTEAQRRSMMNPRLLKTNFMTVFQQLIK